MSKLELYTDGATRPTNPGPSGYGAALFRDDELIAVSSGYLGDSVTNNQAEYAAFVVGLVLAGDQLGPDDKQITVRTDSMLVVQQVRGNWRLSSDKLLPLYQKAVDTIVRLKQEANVQVVIEHVKGHAGIPGNEAADKLAGEAVARQNPTAAWVRALINGALVEEPSEIKAEAAGPKGHEKLKELVFEGLRKRGHPVISVSGPGLIAARDALKRTNEITGSTLANLPELAAIINEKTYLLGLATGYRIDHGRPGELTVNKEALEAYQLLVKAGLNVLLVHRPHGSGRWRKCNDLGWSNSLNEVPVMCFDVAKLSVLQEYNIGEWPTFVSLDRSGMVPFIRHIKSLE